MDKVAMVLAAVIIFGACVLSNQLGNRYRRKKAARTSTVSGGGWWDNQTRTPLSMEESRQLAGHVARFYSLWLADGDMDHRWLCIAIQRDTLTCSAVYKDYNRGQVPGPSYSFSYSLSCQADREDLAAHILRRIKQDYPTCQLYLDGDALILPTNLSV